MGDQCCKKTGKQCAPDTDDALFDPSEFTPFDASQEPIFPPELMLKDEYDNENLVFKNENKTYWFRPTSIDNLLKLKKEYNNAKIVVGNTEVGVEVKFKYFEYPILINPAFIKELSSIEILNDGVKVGASVTLMDLQEFLQNQIDNNPNHETGIYKSIVKMLHYFAGKQIRNVASVGGNIMTGSPISDLNPIFMAATVE
jgi:xanthine dehydrogenase/oxidase